VLQCVAVFCHVLQCVAVCCSVVAVRCSGLQCGAASVLSSVYVPILFSVSWSSVLQCVAVCSSLLQCVAMCCSVLLYTVDCRSVSQRVAVCCRVVCRKSMGEELVGC